MERNLNNYQPEVQETLPKLVLLRQPLEEIKIDSMYADKPEGEMKTQLTYTLEYDVDAYQKIQVFKDTDPDRYQREKDALDGLTKFNMITMLGERLNASTSERIDLVDEEGVMRDRSQNKPLIEWYEKGRLRSIELGSSPDDQLRESAEIEGQKKIQACLTEVGKMMVSISPPGKEGSIYKHNFYDVFHRLSESEIEVVRYMSGLSVVDTLDKLRSLGIDISSDELTDSDLLATPFEIEVGQTPCKTPDDIHTFLHTKLENSLSREEMAIVKNECLPLVNRYLKVVENAPYATDMLKHAYNAIVNKADQIADDLKNGIYQFANQSDNSFALASVVSMMALGSQPVRAVDTGCGFSGGFATGNSSPFSVADFAPGHQRVDEKDQYESLYFFCPSCKRENKRPYGVLLPNCQKCGADVSCGPAEQAEKKKREKLQREKEEQSRVEEIILFEQKEKQKKKDKEGGFLAFLLQPNEMKEAA